MLCNILTTIDILFSLQLHSFDTMNNKLLGTLCFLLLTILLLASCKEDVRVIDTSHLGGNWVVFKAKRNAKLTSTINEAYFNFKPDSTLQTNFLGEEISGSFKINGNIISHNSGDQLDFKIVDLSKDTLILSTRIMDYQFEFLLLNERLDPFNKKEGEMDMQDDDDKQIELDS